MRPRLSSTLVAWLVLLLSLLSRESFAQLVCTPGKGCTVQATPPPIQWQSPSVGGQVQVDPQAQWQAELARRARWEEYFSWRAKVAVDAQASINTRFYIDQMKITARQDPDPYASMPAPFIPQPEDAHVSFPRADLGLLGFCTGAYLGPGKPMYLGYCPAFRYRMNRLLGIAFDPAVVSSHYNDHSFGMVGLRPGVELSFAQGALDISASHAYAVAGLDLWIPFSGNEYSPTAFLGGHVGLGAMISGGRWGVSFEVRGLVRGGLGNQSDPTAREMSSFRVGFEGRAPVISFSFP